MKCTIHFPALEQCKIGRLLLQTLAFITGKEWKLKMASNIKFMAIFGKQKGGHEHWSGRPG